MSDLHLSCAERALVFPALDEQEVRVLRELAGVLGSAHRIWVGQPGPRSPWVPCEQGCCLQLAPGRADQQRAVPWLQFLVRELLTPRSPRAVARAAALGLTVRHQVVGGRPGRTGAVARAEPRRGGGEVVHPGPHGPPAGAS